MKRITAGIAAVAACLTVAAACSRFAAYETIAGSYELAAVDGKPLPANVGPLPTRDGSPRRCSIEYYWGRLELTERGAFEIQFHTRNSCTGADLSRSDANGRYRLDGSEIEFILPQSRLTVAGEIRDHDIVWKDIHELVFRRTD